MDLEGGKSITRAVLKGQEIETFLGPEVETSAASAIWAQKSWLPQPLSP